MSSFCIARSPPLRMLSAAPRLRYIRIPTLNPLNDACRSCQRGMWLQHTYAVGVTHTIPPDSSVETSLTAAIASTTCNHFQALL